MRPVLAARRMIGTPNPLLKLLGRNIDVTKNGHNLFISGHREGEMYVVQLQSPSGRAVFGNTRGTRLTDADFGEYKFIDLDGGNVHTTPVRLQEFVEEWVNQDVLQWVRNEGIDISVKVERGGPLRIDVYDCAVTENVSPSQWDTPPLAGKIVPMRERFGMEWGDLDKEHTFVLSTREGSTVVLKASAESQAPLSMQVLWKLVKSAEAPALAFGPVRELMLKDAILGDESLADLDAGRTLTPPEHLRADQGQAIGWGIMNGADVLCQIASDVRGLLGFGVSAVPVANKSWDVAPASLLRELARTRSPATAVSVMTVWAGVPSTFAIRTQKGSVGILQITEIVDEPIGVRIRYKMLQQTGKTAVEVQKPRPNLVEAFRLLMNAGPLGPELGIALRNNDAEAAKRLLDMVAQMAEQWKNLVVGTALEASVADIEAGLKRVGAALDAGDMQQALEATEGLKAVGREAMKFSQKQGIGPSTAPAAPPVRAL